MHLRSLRAALPAVVAALVVTVTAGAASAASLTVKDPTGDTWQDTTTGSGDSYKAAGSHANTDLVRTVVRHTTTRLVVRATYADLTKSGPRLLFFFRLRTNEGLRRDSGVDTVGSLSGTQHLTKPNGSSNLPCKGLSHTVDYSLNQVTVSIPRSCLSNPRWVQVVIGAMTLSGDPSVVYLDNGQNTTSNDPTNPALWTKRVYKG
ncbi:MAG: hypothetical protein ACXVWU_00195 [Nocardioides sp.]